MATVLVSSSHRPRKVAYFSKLDSLCDQYSRVLVVHADRVGADLLAKIRYCLRGKAVILMGKNTLARTVLRHVIQRIPDYESLIPLVRHNVGLVFCNDDIASVVEIIKANHPPTAARVGLISPIKVVVPAGPTGLDPQQTSFFQVLGVQTEIVKGKIEIVSDYVLINPGEKVTASHCALLSKLNLRPFTCGLEILQVYDNGTVYDAAVLDITDDDILKQFSAGVATVAALSREVGLPNEVSVTHSIIESFKYCVAAVLDSSFVFPEMAKIKEYIENPEAFAAVTPVAAGDVVAAAKVEEEEEPEEEEGDFGLDLFG